jgi:hypothetical protein
MSIHAHEVRAVTSRLRPARAHATGDTGAAPGLFECDRVYQPHPAWSRRENATSSHHGRDAGLRTDPAHLSSTSAGSRPRRQHLDQPTHDLQGVVEFVRHVR